MAYGFPVFSLEIDVGDVGRSISFGGPISKNSPDEAIGEYKEGGLPTVSDGIIDGSNGCVLNPILGRGS